MGRRKEYTIRRTLTRQELEQLTHYDNTILRYGLKNASNNMLAIGFKSCSLIITYVSLAITVPSAAVLANTVYGAIMDLAMPSEHKAVQDNVEQGLSFLLMVEEQMDLNNCVEVDFEIPMLEFIDEKFRVVVGEGQVFRMKKANGDWIS